MFLRIWHFFRLWSHHHFSFPEVLVADLGLQNARYPRYYLTLLSSFSMYLCSSSLFGGIVLVPLKPEPIWNGLGSARKSRHYDIRYPGVVR